MTMRSTWLLVLAVGLLGGCNLITGADRITLSDDDDGDAPDDDGFGGSVGVGQGGGASGPSTTSGTGGALPQADMAPADGVSITRIAVYQGVERKLMEGGAAQSSTTPVVAGREALLRIFYDAPQPVSLTARLTVAGEVFDKEITVGGTSTTGQLTSSINFELPASLVSLGASYRVELLQPIAETSGSNAAATYPAAGGTASLETKKAGTLRIKLVPIQYNADGSGRMPDTSAAQLQKYENDFYAMYPVEHVDLSVRSAVGWNNNVTAGGGGWGNLLNAIADLRQQDSAPFDTYYYGIFSPASSFSTYCSGGCVLGLGFVGSAMDSYGRAAIGIGFSGDVSVDTALHELGHNHGREHAPCGGASGTDGSYPHSGAKIGAWGYNLLTQALYPPNDFVDLMSYCDPAWISDYNFTAIFNRIAQVSGADYYVPPAQQNLTYQRAMVDEGGELTWLSPISLERPPVGIAAPATIETASGPESTTATFIAYDHLPGGMIFVPPTSAPVLESTKALHAFIGGQLYSTP
jgi:hypothetical protein